MLDNRFNDLQDGKRYAGKLAIERALSPAMGLGASVSLSRDALNDPGYSTTGWNVGVLGAGVKPGGLRSALPPSSASCTPTRPLRCSPNDARSLFEPLYRRDVSPASAPAASPILRLSIERNASTIAFYDYRRTRTEVGIVRAILTATGGSPVTTLAEMAERESA